MGGHGKMWCDRGYEVCAVSGRRASKSCGSGFFSVTLQLWNKSDPLLQVWGRPVSHGGFHDLFQGRRVWGQSAFPASAVLWNSFSLNYSTCQVAILWTSTSWTPSTPLLLRDLKTLLSLTALFWIIKTRALVEMGFPSTNPVYPQGQGQHCFLTAARPAANISSCFALARSLKCQE